MPITFDELKSAKIPANQTERKKLNREYLNFIELYKRTE